MDIFLPYTLLAVSLPPMHSLSVAHLNTCLLTLHMLNNRVIPVTVLHRQVRLCNLPVKKFHMFVRSRFDSVLFSHYWFNLIQGVAKTATCRVLVKCDYAVTPYEYCYSKFLMFI